MLRGRIAEYTRSPADECDRRHSDQLRYDVSRDELADVLAGEPRYRVDQLWRGCTALAEPAEITNLPKALRATLEPANCRGADDGRRAQVSDGGDTVKYLFELPGGSRIETVLMLYPDRVTVCVSSQAGCAMACGFCATGQAGLHPPPHRRRDRRAGRARSTQGARDGSPARQRGVHGHG